MTLTPNDEMISEFNRIWTPRIVDDYFVTTPTPVQQIALCLRAREILFGGAVGGGKSEFAIMSALQYVDVPGYSCLVLRRTWPDLNSTGAILDRFQERMAGKNVKKKDQGRLWIFPSGAKIQFGFVSQPKMKTKFQGAEYQKIIFDEATLFEPEIYEYLLTRNRKPTIPCAICTTALTRYVKEDGTVVYRHSGNSNGAKWCDNPIPDPNSISLYKPAPDGLTVFDIPLQVISTANPGGPGHLFFKERFIDPETKKDNVAFVPSTIRDNPYLEKGEYMKTLEGLGAVDRERLLNGDWEVQETGNLFNRGDFIFVDRMPEEAAIKSRVRFWDMAASDGKRSDYTVGALCAVTHDNRWFIEDIIRVQYLPPQVEKLMRDTAEKDGIGVKIFAEEEPGSSGKAFMSHVRRNILGGFQFKSIRPTGPKTARAGAVVSQAGIQNLFVIKDSPNHRWNKDMLDEFTLFPNGLHDDQVDAVAGGFLAQTSLRKPVRLIV